jgi:phthalate 4,5-dioxygenase oxygenase subunit
MLSAADNELLTRTGPATPMGAYFRRFWQPVALSEQVAERDAVPIRVTVMNETWLCLRDSNGRVGLVSPRCPHRGADLVWGRNEDCGLRCAYHGWKFDVDGKPVDLPNVEPGSALYRNVRLKAHPTREFGNIVWAWLGPGDPPADVPALEFGLVPPSHRFVTKKLQQCNWAQTMEGALDTAHFSFLHMPAPSVQSNDNPDAPADERRLRWIRDDPRPKFQIVPHDCGFIIGASRAADGGELYWRTSQFMLPAHATTPSTLPGETYFGYTFVPITDEDCWIYTYAWNPARPLTNAEREKYATGHGVVAEVDKDYVPLRNKGNGYLRDIEDMKHHSFTGVKGVAEQDAMVQESQGAIADRSQEILTPTDMAVVRFRSTLLEGARALRDRGLAPPSAAMPAAYTLRSGSWIAPAGTPFGEVMMQRFGDPVGRAVN